MLKFENKILTKEMIQGLQEIRKIHDSGKPVIASEVKASLTNLYSENLIEPNKVDINGESVQVCEITQFGWEVIKHLDNDKQGAQ